MRQRKTQQLNIERSRANYFQRINTPYKYPECTPDQFLEIIVNRGIQLQMSEHWEYKFEILPYLKPYYELLAHYFLGLPTVEDYNILAVRDISLSKGIMLRGGYGVGKTVMMKLYSINPVQSYRVEPVQKIVSIHDRFATKGESELLLEQASQYYPLPYGTTQAIHIDNGFFGQQALGLCYDDLGAEPLGNKFGAVNVMKRILDNCYMNRGSSHRADIHRTAAHTHIITNSTDDELARNYDNRILDRFNEMFNIIELPETESLR